MFRKIKILTITVCEMIKAFPSIIKESREEWAESEECKRIEEYWDEKTTFVHRRALFVGAVLGVVFGISVAWLSLLWAVELAMK